MSAEQQTEMHTDLLSKLDATDLSEIVFVEVPLAQSVVVILPGCQRAWASLEVDIPPQCTILKVDLYKRNNRCDQ
jgi:hypothetical protein